MILNELLRFSLSLKCYETLTTVEIEEPYLVTVRKFVFFVSDDLCGQHHLLKCGQEALKKRKSKSILRINRLLFMLNPTLLTPLL